MRLDKFDNPVFNEIDIYNAIYAGQIADIHKLTVDPSGDITRLADTATIKFDVYNEVINELDIPAYDNAMQSNWYMPAEYYTFDISEYCMSKCSSDKQRSRIMDEMFEFENRGLIPLLQWMKYFVDICVASDVLWGVGRGSSTASYVLFMIGVHRIDSLKYELDYKEFLR